VTEGGDVPPALQHLPTDYAPGDAETSEFQFKENADGSAEKALGLAAAPTAEEQVTIDQYHG
jgi:hypothetical protein